MTDELSDRLLSSEEQRAKLARLLQAQPGRLKLSPLSFSQERLWFLEQLMPDVSANITQRIRLKGVLDVVALRQGLDAVVRRHESLRTTLVTVAGRPVQAIAPSLSLSVPLVSLEHLPSEERDAEAQRLAEDEGNYVFDLAQGPLFRASLLKLGPELHWLILNIHHSVADGWSMGILVRELAAFYQGYVQESPPSLPELPIQYADFALRQRRMLDSKALDAHLTYWADRLADFSAPSSFVPEQRRSTVQSFAGAELPVTFPKVLGEGLQALSRQEQGTLFMTLLAGFSALLCRYVGSPDVCVGTLIANRSLKQVESLIGFFVNFLALRVDASGNPTFRELLRRVQTVTLDAYAHQDAPIDAVLDAWQHRRQSRLPLFRTMLVLQNVPLPVVKLPGLEIEASRPGQAQNADMDLTLYLFIREQGLSGYVQYNTDVLDAASVQRIVQHYQTLLESAVAAPDTPIQALAWMTEEETHQTLVKFNRTASLETAGLTFKTLFEAQAARTSQAEAVSLAGNSLSYSELNARANQLAHYVRTLGVGPEAMVGIAIPRSLAMIVALLAVFKAGGSYIPLDPAYPQERLSSILDEARASVLLTLERVRDLIPARFAGRVVSLDGSARDAIARQSTSNLPDSAMAQNLAYTIFTSGSTGRPKGVLIPQAALANYALSTQRRFDLTPEDRVLQFATLNFDTAVEEIYPTLLSGAKLVLRAEGVIELPETLLRFCGHERVSVLSLPTAYWHTLVTDLASGGLAWPASLRLVVVGGERMLPDMLHLWNDVQARGCIPASVRLINNYGPTETTVVATEADLTHARAVTIGSPINNVRCYVLDRMLRPVPVGVPGELCIAGPGLARGYLNCPGQTADAFVPNPFDAAPGARMYRTGDLVCHRPDGALEFLGRLDNQVKLRGFRVEPDEIQVVFNAHPAVQETLVVILADDDLPSTQRLVAYVVTKQACAVPTADLRAFAQQRLPDYMLPAAIVFLDAFPLTPAGKIDRAALPAPDQAGDEAEFASPEGPVEEKLAEIWGRLLNLKRIGAYDDFFELGGHSLLATRMIYTVNQTFHIKLSVRAIFEEPTLAGLALVIEEMLLDELDTQIDSGGLGGENE